MIPELNYITYDEHNIIVGRATDLYTAALGVLDTQEQRNIRCGNAVVMQFYKGKIVYMGNGAREAAEAMDFAIKRIAHVEKMLEDLKKAVTPLNTIYESWQIETGIDIFKEFLMGYDDEFLHETFINIHDEVVKR